MEEDSARLLALDAAPVQGHGSNGAGHEPVVRGQVFHVLGGDPDTATCRCHQLLPPQERDYGRWSGCIAVLPSGPASRPATAVRVSGGPFHAQYLSRATHGRQPGSRGGLPGSVPCGLRAPGYALRSMVSSALASSASLNLPSATSVVLRLPSEAARSLWYRSGWAAASSRRIATASPVSRPGGAVPRRRCRGRSARGRGRCGTCPGWRRLVPGGSRPPPRPPPPRRPGGPP